MVKADQAQVDDLLGGGTVAEAHRHKLKGLDGLRAVAVLAVMLSHFERFLPPGPFDAVRPALQYGWVGVDVFFALSGFLITGILLQTKGATNYFRVFYTRRVLRIFPIYYLTLAVIFVAATHVGGADARFPPAADAPWYVLYLENWLGVLRNAWPPNVLGHFWSLAIEEQFYLVWPVLVFALARRRLALVAGALCLVALLSRIITIAHYGPGFSSAAGLATTARMDSLLIGALAALAYVRADRLVAIRRACAYWPVPFAAFAAGLLVAPGADERSLFVQTVGYPLLSAGAAALILLLAVTDGSATPLHRALGLVWLRRAGVYSYGMYVYHVPLLGACELVVFDRLPAALRGNSMVCAVYVGLLIVLTFAVAAASFELFERRVLALKRYAEPAFAAAASRPSQPAQARSRRDDRAPL